MCWGYTSPRLHLYVLILKGICLDLDSEIPGGFQRKPRSRTDPADTREASTSNSRSAGTHRAPESLYEALRVRGTRPLLKDQPLSLLPRSCSFPQRKIPCPSANARQQGSPTHSRKETGNTLPVFCPGLGMAPGPVAMETVSPTVSGNSLATNTACA